MKLDFWIIGLTLAGVSCRPIPVQETGAPGSSSVAQPGGRNPDALTMTWPEGMKGKWDEARRGQFQADVARWQHEKGLAGVPIRYEGQCRNYSG